jgi:hypothetical protein
MTDAPSKTGSRPASAPASGAAKPPSKRAAVAKSATRAADRVREGASEAARRTAEGIEANPMSVVVGGVALGVLAGMFVPRSRKETELLKPVGRKVREGAETAAKAAVEAGKAELAVVGLSRVGASESVGKLVEGLGKAIASASAAAKESRKAGK